jgi:hypothetical protein
MSQFRENLQRAQERERIAAVRPVHSYPATGTDKQLHVCFLNRSLVPRLRMTQGVCTDLASTTPAKTTRGDGGDA